MSPFYWRALPVMSVSPLFVIDNVNPPKGETERVSHQMDTSQWCLLKRLSILEHFNIRDQ